MRILHLDTGREMRGGQWQVLRLIEGLKAGGIDCTLLARRGSPLAIHARERGLRVESLALARVWDQARRHDIVHAHDAKAHNLTTIVSERPVVISRRVAFPIGSGWKYRRATRYIAVSEFVKSVLIAGDVPPEKIDVVYDGVPVLEPATGNRVMALASADPGKGEMLAQEAARLAGAELELTSDPERDFNRAAVLLYITQSEGLGSGALLAMSAGVAVVASNVGGLREIVRDGETGLLVENKAETIAAALRGLVEDPDRTRRIGAAARHQVMERFTVEQMVRRTMEVYRRVCS